MQFKTKLTLKDVMESKIREYYSSSECNEWFGLHHEKQAN